MFARDVILSLVYGASLWFWVFVTSGVCLHVL